MLYKITSPATSQEDPVQKTLLLLDEKGYVRSCNNYAEIDLGYPIAEIIGSHFGITYVNEDQEKNLPSMHLQNALEKGSTYCQRLIPWYKGSTFNCKSVIIALYNADATVSGFSMEIQNLANKKEGAEPDLVVKSNDDTTKNEKRFRALIENNVDIISLIDAKGEIIYLSPNSVKMIGYAPKEVVGTDAVSFFHPDDVADVVKRLNFILDNPGVPVRRSARMRHKNGHYIWTEGVTTNLLLDENVGAIVGNFQDITERKLAEEKAKLVAANLDAILENSSESLFLTDVDGIILAFNNNSVKTNLLTCRDVFKVRTNIVDYIVPSRQVLFKDMIRHVAAGNSVRYDQAFTDFEGRFHCYDFSINPVFEDGIVKNICYSGRDITEHKQAEEKIIKTNRLYSFLSHINQAIVHVDGEQNIFKEACRIAVDTGNFKAAWIGLIDKENEVVDLIESAGIPLEDKPLFANNRYIEIGPQAHVVNTGTPFISNNVDDDHKLLEWKNYATERGIRSRMVLPIKKTGAIIATFNLYSAETDFFDPQEMELLKEIASDISFAIEVFEKEKYRKQVEQRIIHSELRLKQAHAIAHVGSWELDLTTGLEIWSEEHCRIYGISPDDNIQTLDSWMSLIYPDDQDAVKRAVQECREELKECVFDHRIILSDGSIKHVRCQVQFGYNALGKPVGLYGIAHDITAQKKAEEKIINANRLYAFISQINQTIVQVSDESTLFDEARRIAVEIGRFNLAWISIPNKVTKRLNIAAHCNATESDLEILNNLEYDSNGPLGSVLNTGDLFAINDFERDAPNEYFKKYAALRGFRSCIVLPIFKEGETIGAYNLVSARANLFDEDETRLLKEATSDISFALDVLEKDKRRKQMEERVVQSELRLKEAQSIAHVGSWDIDFATGKVEWSEEACNIYGITDKSHQQSYDTWLSFIHPDDLEHVKKESMNGSGSFSSTAFYHRIVRTDGAIRHVYSQAQYKFNPDGKPIGLNGAVHDITDMKEAEAALAHSEANLRMIMDLIPQCIFVKDYDGRFLFVNKSFAALYGLTVHQLTGKPLLETIPEKNKSEDFLKEDQEVILSGKIKTMPGNVFIDSKGNRRLFHTIKVPYIEAGTNKHAVLGMAMDITEQKLAEEERAKMVADIVQRNKNLEQFSYIVSHNLRSPVANIMGLAQVMNLPDLEEKEKLEIIDGLSAAAKKLDTVIQDLNYILQVKHKENIVKEAVKFSELLNDIKLSIATLIRNDQVLIESDCSAINETHSVRSYLYSILMNLVSNSIKYKKPEIAPIINIRSSLKGNNIQITFKDNALGIDLSRNGDEIFGLYKRFHNHVDGKGMGLYMVKTQVESLGGTISISSEINEGTEFVIEFAMN